MSSNNFLKKQTPLMKQYYNIKKKINSLFYSLMFACLCLYGIKAGNNTYYFISLFFVAGHLFNQIRILNINNQDLCLSIFKSNQYLGIIISTSAPLAVELNLIKPL